MATELPGENVTTLAQIADDYAQGLRDDVTLSDVLAAMRDTSVATLFGSGVQAGAGQAMQTAAARANARAEARRASASAVKEPPEQDGPFAPATPPADPPTAPPEAPPAAVPGSTPAPNGAVPQNAQDDNWTVVSNEPASATTTAEPPPVEAAVPPQSEVPSPPQQTTPELDTRVSPVAPAAAAGDGGAPQAPKAVRFGQAERLFDKPPVPVTEVDPTPFKTAKEARAHAIHNLRGTYRNRDTGWDVAISRVGIEKAASQSGRTGGVHWRALRGLPQLVDRAVLIESHPDRRDSGFVAVHRLVAPMRMGDRLYRVKLTVREDAQGHHFYDHAHSEIERADVQNGSPPAGGDVAVTTTVADKSTAPGPSAQAISIADLLAGQVRDADGQPFASEKRVTEAPPVAGRQKIDGATRV